MDVRTLRALEWDRVLALLSLCASTREGKERARTLVPESEPDAVLHRHARVGECLRGEALSGRLSLEGYERVSTRVPRGVSFPLEAFRRLRGDLRVWQRARAWLKDGASPKPALSASLPHRDGVSSLARLLERLLDDRGEVADGASERLRGLRRERERARTQVLSRMESLADSLGTPVLREASYTLRNGRFVLPVHASHKSQVKGILHDTSSSGGTAFIEPLEVVDLNNRLTDLESHEREEIQRILEEASEKVSAESQELEAAFDALEALDLDLACSRLGRHYGGILPLVNAGESLVLRGARHPLLDASLAPLRKEAGQESFPGKAVPLDLALSLDGTRTLVISGPNAGGKSVAVKTLGLLCAMHQAGIPIPVAEGTSLPAFPFLHATVGDSQSILDSLSTFSARMAALKEAFENLREPFLVILDELGSGTDPSEGAALGEAILLHLHSRRGYTVCSTHYEAVKARAMVTEGMGNACMEFDEATLAPTFRLRMGKVGASRALQIAERSGIPAPILEAARAFLPEGERHLKEVLSALDEEIAAHERESLRLKEKGRDLDELRGRLQEDKRALEAERASFLASLPEKLRSWEERFMEGLKPEINRQSVRRAARKVLPEVVEAAREELGLPKEQAPRPEAFSPGDCVRVRGFGITGTVVCVDAGTGKLQLDCNGKTLSVGQGDVDLLPPAGSKPAPVKVGGVTVSSKDARLELNLIGKTVAEAEAELEPFMDRAAMAGFGHVRIIHGIGTGRLKTAVRQWLKGCPQVASWEEAPVSGGGAGATLVHLRE
jgi:DNA mismatch repair protein MutS2